MMMITNVLDLTHIRDIPTLNSSNNVLRGHSRIRASTCIPRRWMAGSPCRWPVEVEIKMNPYIPQKSISCDSWMVFFPRLLRHTLNLWNPSNPFSIARRSRWKPCHGGKSTTRRRYHPRFGCHHGWLGSSIEDLLWHGACAGWIAGWPAPSGSLWIMGSKEWLKLKR